MEGCCQTTVVWLWCWTHLSLMRFEPWIRFESWVLSLTKLSFNYDLYRIVYCSILWSNDACDIQGKLLFTSVLSLILFTTIRWWFDSISRCPFEISKWLNDFDNIWSLHRDDWQLKRGFHYLRIKADKLDLVARCCHSACVDTRPQSPQSPQHGSSPTLVLLPVSDTLLDTLPLALATNSSCRTRYLN